MSATGKTRKRPVVITGGAGFVGTNLAARLMKAGENVIVLDNLSRPGVERNWQWLSRHFPDQVRLMQGDVRNEEFVQTVVNQAGSVFHFAAQVAVTTSLVSPIDDFEVNARGTINLLEAIRHTGRRIPLLFTSTNKVYGDLEDVQLEVIGTRYLPTRKDVAAKGIGEDRSIEFHSPYGCSKGAADQYVLDYARTFGIPAVVFRMSCIYGPHQYGNEDQGWVAHFILQALRDEMITLYGDGKQVRDILFVEDLVEAMYIARAMIDHLSGQAFNIGGGAGNALSLLELTEMIGDLKGDAPELEFSKWRAADQRYYVSDISRFSSLTGWKPRVNVREGVRRLYEWLAEFGVVAKPAAAAAKHSRPSPLPL